MHHVQRVQHREGRGKHRRNDGEVFGYVVGNRKRGQRAARHQELLANLHNLNQLGRVGVEVDHVAGLLGCLRARVHGHAHIGLRQCGGIVGAVAGHGYQFALALLTLDQVHLVLGLGLGQKVVHSSFARNHRRGQRVVAGNHDGANAHGAQPRQALLQTALDDVLQVNHAQCGRVLRHHQRRTAQPRYIFHRVAYLLRQLRPLLFKEACNRIHRALANAHARQVHSAHARLRGEGNKLHMRAFQMASAQVVLLLGQHHNRAAFGRFIGKRRQLRRVGQVIVRDVRRGNELRGLAIAQGDGTGLVQQQGIHVAGGFDRASAHGQHVVLDETVHAGDADGRKQTADGGGNEAYQQRDQHKHGLRRVRVDGEGLQRDHRQQKDNCQARQQNAQRNLVRRLLPRGAFHQRNHAVEECLAGVRGNFHLDPVAQHLGAAGYGRAVAASLANHRSRFARNGRLVHRRHTFDHFAVAGNVVSGSNIDDVARAQLPACNLLKAAVGHVALGHGLALGFAQRVGLRLTTAFGHGFSKVCKQHREPQPQSDLQVEAEAGAPVNGIVQQQRRGQQAANLHHEHHRVLDHDARVQLAHGIHRCLGHNRGIPQTCFLCHVLLSWFVQPWLEQLT